MNKSIIMNEPCEIIATTSISPLISKCVIKVCYVGDKPNRNGSIITKDVAKQMGSTLGGSPIVGYYNKEKKDFEEHNRVINITSEGVEMMDTTKPYGFVAPDAKVWFQKFLDNDSEEHEYLMTEGYLWTEQYPECKRIIEQGNNQSMELDEKTLKGNWSENSNGLPEFFIINEALISKLCILGEQVEPCFEGATITKSTFSLSDNFQNKLFSMLEELKDIMNGGTEKMDISIEKNSDELNEQIETNFSDKEEILNLNESEIEVEFKENKKEEKKSENEDKKDSEDSENSDSNTEEENSENSNEESEGSETSEDEKKKKNDDEYACGGGGSGGGSSGSKKKKTYSSEEYEDLNNKLSSLEEQYSNLQLEFNKMKEENASLSEFKANIERAEKQNMIENTFYMLSNEDKSDVINNIDTYSLDEIEKRLSVICVRNKVSFQVDTPVNEPMSYNLQDQSEYSAVPEWIKAVAETAKSL